MDVTGCDRLREVTAGCRAVLLSATEGEAELLHAAMLSAERHVVASKAIYAGTLEVDHRGGGDHTAGAPSVSVVLGITGCDKANAAHLLTCLLQAMEPAPLLVLQMGVAGALPSPGPGPSANVGDIVLATQETYFDTGSSSPAGWLSAAEIGLPIACPSGRELGGIFSLDSDLIGTAQEVIEGIEWPESAKAIVNGTGAVEADAPSKEAGSVSWPALVGRTDGRPTVLLGPCVTGSLVTGLRSEAEAIAARFGALAESMEGAAAAHVCALYGVPFLEIRGISNMVVDRDRDGWQVRRAAAVAGWATLAVIGALGRLPLRRGA